MSRRRRWSDLIPGVIAVLALAAGVVAVLLFARVGTLRGQKILLFATVAEGRGLSAGSEVWLAGERIGVVDRIAFLPPSADTSQRLILSLSVLERHREFIRRGAAVRVHPGGNLIGAPVVSIALGAPASSPVRDGDTLRSVRETDVDRMRAQFQESTTQLPQILANVQVLATQLRATKGTLGALGLEGPGRMAQTTGAARRALASMSAPSGMIGGFANGSGAATHARSAIARADSIRALLAMSDSRSLGRFSRDSALLRHVESVRRELDAVALLLAEPRGAAGRLQQDSALAQELTRTRAEIAALIADLKRNPLRYLSF